MIKATVFNSIVHYLQCKMRDYVTGVQRHHLNFKPMILTFSCTIYHRLFIKYEDGISHAYCKAYAKQITYIAVYLTLSRDRGGGEGAFGARINFVDV